MAVLGLILLAAAGVLTAAVVTSNTDKLAVDLWNISVSNVTLGVVFVAGMITTVVAVVGLGLLMGGVRRTRRLRKERRSLQRENEELAQRVESTPDTTGPTTRYDERPVEYGRSDTTVVNRQVTDDTTRMDAPVYDRDQADGSTAASQRRSFPRREERTHTETVTRDS